ncbi:MAG TPA: hypothetical protein VHG08_02915 [Longimicrobium sp.]|nr:hypothetical protein [Longimicrobium sp.]
MPHPHDAEDDEPFEREDFATRKTRRLRDEKKDFRDLLAVGVIGLGMLVVGTSMCWLTVVDLRRGWLDLDGTDVVYASRDPGEFYGTAAFMAAMGLFSAQLGARMLRHTVREARRTARHARRVERAGTGRR